MVKFWAVRQQSTGCFSFRKMGHIFRRGAWISPYIIIIIIIGDRVRSAILAKASSSWGDNSAVQEDHSLLMSRDMLILPVADIHSLLMNMDNFILPSPILVDFPTEGTS